MSAQWHLGLSIQFESRQGTVRPGGRRRNFEPTCKPTGSARRGFAVSAMASISMTHRMHVPMAPRPRTTHWQHLLDDAKYDGGLTVAASRNLTLTFEERRNVINFFLER